MLLSALLILGQATEQPTLAMTSVECYPVKICGGELEADRVYLQNKLESAVLAAADGRLKLIRDGTAHVTEVDDEQFDPLLEEWFGIRRPDR